MKNKLIRLFITGLLLLSCGINIFAQDSTDTEPVDSTGEYTQPESLGDTVLARYEFKTGDSMQEYRKDKDFAYMKYLDSILRRTKDLTVDTFNINEATSSGSSRQSERSSRRERTVPSINIFSSPLMKIILWVLAAFLIGFLIYKLFLGENFFRRNRAYKMPDIQKEDEDLSEASAYDKLIAQAVANKNYRLAIRYSYLQTLKKLSDIGLLQFAADKTNYQYVNELRGKPYQNDFAAITLNYEYVWYGRFDINEDIYHRLSGEYKSFNQKI